MPTRSLMRKASAGEILSSPRAFSSRHFLKLIEDTGKVGFWSADLGTEQVEASPGLSRILGLDPLEVVSFGLVLDLIHPEDRAVHGDQIAVLRAGQPISREFRVIRPDRTQRWIQHKAEAIIGPNGQPSQGVGVMFDVTAQHDAMNSLMHRHDRLNALITATASVFWVNKANGEPSEMPQWMALTGQSYAETQGLGWLNAVHPDDRARTIAAWTTAVEHTTPYNTEYRVHCADGIYRWYNARGVPIQNKDGSVREWVGICLSVPGRHRYGASLSGSKLSSVSLSDAVWSGPATPELHVTDVMLTPGQVRAARGLTNLSKDELALRANVSVSTINRLEDPDSAVRPRADTVLAVRCALERAGVEFTFEPGRKPGIRET